MAHEIAFVVLLLRVLVHAEGVKLPNYPDPLTKRRRSGAPTSGTFETSNQYRTTSFDPVRALSIEQSSSLDLSKTETHFLSFASRNYGQHADFTTDDKLRAGSSSVNARRSPMDLLARLYRSKATLFVRNRAAHELDISRIENIQPILSRATKITSTSQVVSVQPQVVAISATTAPDLKSSTTQLSARPTTDVSLSSPIQTTSWSTIAAKSSVTAPTYTLSSHVHSTTSSTPLATTNSTIQPTNAASFSVPSISTSAPFSSTSSNKSYHTTPPLQTTALPPQTAAKRSSSASSFSSYPVQSDPFTSTKRKEFESDIRTTLSPAMNPTSELLEATTSSEVPVSSPPPPERASNGDVNLAVGREVEVVFKPNKETIFAEPEWAPGGERGFSSQLVLQVPMISTLSRNRLIVERVTQSEYLHVVELRFCGGVDSRAYILDSDPRKNTFLEPKYAATPITGGNKTCVNALRILLPSSSLHEESFILLSSKLPSPNSALIATVLLTKNRYLKHPWNVQVLRESVSVSSAAVADTVTSIFLVSSAPWKGHEELRSLEIEDFKANSMDPFCDQTGTTMVSLIAGASLGIVDRVRIIPLPIGGCDPAKGDEGELLLALGEVAQQLSKPAITIKRAVIVLQDTEVLQQSLKNGRLQDVLSRVAQLGAITVIPVSKCSSLSGIEGDFLSVGSFGLDITDSGILKSDNVLLSENISACAASLDLTAPGIGVSGAATFGILARRQVTDSSLAAAAAVGWLVAMSASSPYELFHIKHIKEAALSLPTRTFKNTLLGPESTARVIGYGNSSLYNQFSAALREKNIIDDATSDDSDSGRDRILSSISNQTFYGITAGVFVVCLAAAAGIGILTARRVDDSGSLSPVADTELPPSPSARRQQISPRGLKRENTANGTSQLQSSAAVTPVNRSEAQIDIDNCSESISPVPTAAPFHKSFPTPQAVTSQRYSGSVYGPDTDSDRVVGEHSSKRVEPLKMSGSSSSLQRSGLTLTPSTSGMVQRSTSRSQSGTDQAGKRRNVKTRLLTITKIQKPAASPGASKASWFATPKAGAKPVPEVFNDGEKAESKECSDDDRDAKDTPASS